MTDQGPASRRRTFAYKALLPIVLVVVTTFLAVAVVLEVAARNSDIDALERQTQLVAGTVSREIEAIVWQQESVTIWDVAIANLRRIDFDWLDDNAGIWLHEYFGIDRVFILDPAGKPVYGMMDGKRVDPGFYTAHASLLDPIAARLRRDALETGVTGEHEVVLLENRPAIIGASLVVSDTGKIKQAPGTEYLHIAIRFMDASFLNGLAEKTMVKAPRFSWTENVGPSQGAHPVLDGTGRTVGYVAWVADRPGARLMTQTWPMLGIAALLLAGVVFLMGRQILRASGALESSEAQAKHIAFHDALTGLANRARFNLEMEDAMRRVADGERIALLYLDLDRFKYVNDTFGHQAGDALIRAFADRLTGILRSTDRVARLGGDEFAIIQADVAGESEITALCRRVLETVAEPFEVGGHATYIGTSIGVAVAPYHGADVTELVRKSDIALYSAKAGGRNRYRIFATEMDITMRRRQRTEQDLRHALELGGQIGVCYQPVIEASSLDLVGMEALVRWEHPDRGPLAPHEFIPIAEETGLIVPLGELVLREALKTAAQVAHLTVAVNVSPVQVQTSSFPARLKAMIAEAGIDPARVELEITETILMDGHERSTAALAELKALGVRIALDDFGTGYSSLGYLRAFAVDRIKIDQSFVRNVTTDPAAAEIVRAIVSMGQALGMKVTAEGVETDAQFNLLAGTGCDDVQGYLFSPPVPAPTMLAFAAGRPLPSIRSRVHLARGVA